MFQTQKKTPLGLYAFEDWRKQRNGLTGEEKCPDYLLEEPGADQLNYWLSRFIAEVWHSDGDLYPASMLYQLLAGLLRYTRSKTKDCPNFTDKKDARFAELSGTCESVACQLREQGGSRC